MRALYPLPLTHLHGVAHLEQDVAAALLVAVLCLEQAVAAEPLVAQRRQRSGGALSGGGLESVQRLRGEGGCEGGREAVRVWWRVVAVMVASRPAAQ